MSSTASPRVQVTVYSDLACPWCYVGLKRLDKALASMPEVAAEREWHAFLLDWHAPEGGQPIEEALQKKFGSRGGAIMQRLVSAGQPDGAAFAGWKWRANTVKGHMLVALARRHGKSHEANELLFQKSYETGDNISDTATLLDVGRQLGLPEAELQAAFGGDGLDGELLREVQQDDAVAKRELGVTGVPFFLISGGAGGKAYALSGAQPPEAFREAVQLALKEAGGGAGAGGDGAACAREGCP